MLRGVGALFLWLALCGIAAIGAEAIKFDSLKARNRTYYDITVLGASETDLYFKHSRGIANVKLKYLEPEMQTRFDYDPRLAEEAERRQLQEDSAYQETVAIELSTRAQTAIKATRDEAATSEDSLADPVTNQSLINQPAPKLTVEQWLGEKPATEDRALLVFFWSTWSIPCRKAIPELNNYHKKFHDQLAVIGLSAEPFAEVSALSEPKIEFPLAIDTKRTLALAINVTSVPLVLLVDAKGVVRYQGHPAALETAKLRKLLGAESKE